jgi:tRNA(Arg) A34 adenosine deaminase TadA
MSLPKPLSLAVPSAAEPEAPAAAASEAFMRRALAAAEDAARIGEVPVGAVVVVRDEVVAVAHNERETTNDPTAHAEVVAIRAACTKLGTFQLDGCEVYTTCEPCPMCLGAIYWARPARVYYANTAADAARIGFDDSDIYAQLGLPLRARRIPMTQIMRDEALQAFNEWAAKADKVEY